MQDRCPYHPESPAGLVPPDAPDAAESGWVGWLVGCCELPAWRCPLGALNPIEARFCTLHGCERPGLDRMAHELDPAVPPPRPRVRALPLAPVADGGSTPCLAGNILVYLTEGGRLVAVDVARDIGVVFLHSGVRAASLRLDGSRVVGILRTVGGTRALAWSSRRLRELLPTGGGDGEHLASPARLGGAALTGLPRDQTRVHVGSGILRLVVEHDPPPDELAERYRAVTGVAPGPWLIRRAPNPLGPNVPFPDLRPVQLWQVPVPVPGGTLLLGQIRRGARLAAGAVLVPTVAAVEEVA